MRDLPSLAVTAPVSVVALIPSAQMPKSRQVHVRLTRTSEEIITGFWLDGEGKLLIPQKLLFEADWIYDLDAKKVMKNKTGKKFLIPLGVQEVDRSWLGDRGYVRMRRPQP